jgi:hypothetical protein
MIENESASGSASGTVRAESSAIQFPNYENPSGVIIAPPKFHSPLYKMMKMMMKPKMKLKSRLPKAVKHVKHKKVKFY